MYRNDYHRDQYHYGQRGDSYGSQGTPYRAGNSIDRKLGQDNYRPNSKTNQQPSTANNGPGEEDRRHDMRAVISKFGDETSMHSITQIKSRSRWYTKTFWVLILLGGLFAVGLQFSQIFREFFQYPTSTNMDLDYDFLDFPSVTVCNLNPFRKSKIPILPTKMQAFITMSQPDKSIKSTPAGRKRRQVKEESDDVEDKSRQRRAVDNAQKFGSSGSVASSKNANRRNKFLDLVGDLPPDVYLNASHSLENMLLACSFNGYECSASDFTPTRKPQYGTCYTFNSRELNKRAFKTVRSGSAYGLTVSLYIQEHEYIPGINDGMGIRVAIHEFGTEPVMQAESVSVAPGTQTEIAMKTVNITRLSSWPHSCSNGPGFEEMFNRSYTRVYCLESCEDRLIARDCRCYRKSHFDMYPESRKVNLPGCDYTNANITRCVKKAQQYLEDDTTFCKDICGQACNEVIYDQRLSFHLWPDNGLWYQLINEVCDADGEEELNCQYFKDIDSNPNVTGQQKRAVLRANFIGLQVFYQELNYESITQIETYTVASFFSNIGGTLGLWIGASVITWVELVYLMIQLLYTASCRRLVTKRRDKPKPAPREPQFPDNHYRQENNRVRYTDYR